MEPEPEPKKCSVLVLNLTEGRGFIQAGIKLFGGIDWKEHRAAKTGQRIVRMLAVYEEILKDKERCLCLEISVQELVYNLMHSWTFAMMNKNTHLQFKRKCLVLILSFVFLRYRTF